MWNKLSFRKGFLIKYIPLKYLDFENVNPAYEEIQSFRKPLDQGEDSDESEIDDVQDSVNRVMFQVGDKIKVINGELKNLTGEIIDVKNRTIKFRPFSEQIKFDLQLD